MVVDVVVVVLNVVLEASTVVEKDDVTPATRNYGVAESCTIIEVVAMVVLSVADLAGVGTVVV